jgi:hypothetical protein
LRAFLVLLIFYLGRFTKVRETIVSPIAVYVIDIHRRPFSPDVKEGEPMRQVQLAVDRKLYVPILPLAASESSSRPAASRNQSPKLPRFLVV